MFRPLCGTFFCVFLLFGQLLDNASAQFKIPEVKLEALSPKGFRVSIPDIPGIQLFAFHGKLNNGGISNVEPGEFSKDIREAVNNFWVYFEPELTLQVGDKISYWVFVQYQRLGYRKDQQFWTVTELVKTKEVDCEILSNTLTNINGSICKRNLIFEDKFDRNGLDTSKWTKEQYIPTYNGPDYEFCYYKDDPTNIYFKGNTLILKPVPLTTDNEVRGSLNLRKGCTSKNGAECYFKQGGVSLLPPTRSARITSKLSFQYGTVEIRAKLPAGDWLFPIIQLTPTNETIAKQYKVWIAYSRGNDHLLPNLQGVDIGSHLLFAGPIRSPIEPQRSEELRSRLDTEPYHREMHVYTLVWEKNLMRFLIDNEEYGSVQNVGEIYTYQSYLSLGVGVGGINDFPDNFVSGNNPKPWKNKDRKQFKDFFEARDKWATTWVEDNSALQVDYVKITAI